MPSLSRTRSHLTQVWSGARALGTRLQGVTGLLIVVLIALVTSPRASDGALIFLEPGNLTDILRQVSVIGILSLGMTFVILTAGIDLSVGSLLALASSIVALLLTRSVVPGSLPIAVGTAIAIAIASATALGFVNGLVVAKLRVQPFIVTLATMIGVRGIARSLTSNTNVDVGFGDDAAALFAKVISSKVIVIGSFAVLATGLSLLLTRTIFGRYVRGLGDNERAAIYAGLPTARVKIWTYTLSGLLTGYAAVLHTAQNHQGSPNAGMSYELEAIAAVVIGGTHLAGGRGSVGGTVIGTLIMGTLTNVLRLNNVDSNLEMVLKAIIIIGAVWLQQRTGERA